MAKAIEDYPNLMAQAVSEEEARLYVARRQLEPRQKRHRGWAVQGPFPWPQFCLAMRLPGKALGIWLLIHHRQRMSKQPWVTLPTELLLEAGIPRKTKDNALGVLERHGLIQTQRKTGCSTRMALVPISVEDTGDLATTGGYGDAGG